MGNSHTPEISIGLGKVEGPSVGAKTAAVGNGHFLERKGGLGNDKHPVSVVSAVYVGKSCGISDSNVLVTDDKIGVSVSSVGVGIEQNQTPSGSECVNGSLNVRKRSGGTAIAPWSPGLSTARGILDIDCVGCSHGGKYEDDCQAKKYLVKRKHGQSRWMVTGGL
jgi:hypothetical protein